MNQWISESVIRWTDVLVNQRIQESMSQLNQQIDDSVNQWINEPMNQWMSELISEWVKNQWVNEW